MARGRMISHTVATDKRLNSISEEAELAFLKTIPHLDRDGIIIGDPILLTAQVCPRRPKLGAMMEEIIQEWVDAGLAILYETDEDPLLFFPGFSKNQVGLRYDREPASIFPPPPGYYRNGNGLEPTPAESTQAPPTSGDNPPASGNLPATFRQPSGTLPPEVEENRKENNTTTARETIRNDSDAAGSGSVPPAAKPPGWQDVVNAYESNIGMFTALSAEMVQSAVGEYGAILVVDAIRESVRQNVRKWSYVDGVLKRWNANGRDSPRAKDTPRKPPSTITIFNQYTNQYEERKVS